MVMEKSVSNLEEFEDFAKKIARSIRGSEVFALIGELGAGKTAFSKVLLKALGIRSEVTSPTFVIMIPYETKSPSLDVYHMDLYRLDGYEEVKALGVEDLWGKPKTVFLIEWADKIKKHLPKSTIYIKFQIQGTGRKINIENAPAYFKI
jgi:tRNA threonylcarbamoyladenosine biosynthesis protein TsaE